MLYEEGEKVLLTQDIGKEGKDFFFRKDTEIKFVRTLNHSIQSPMVLVELPNGNCVTLPELAIRKTTAKEYLKALEAYNKQLMKDNPLLRLHHPNLLVRCYYRVVYGLKRIFVQPFKKFFGEVKSSPQNASLDRVKDIINED